MLQHLTLGSAPKRQTEFTGDAMDWATTHLLPEPLSCPGTFVLSKYAI